MQITVISFDPEGSLFAAIRQKELLQVENWVFSDSFENFIAHFQSVPAAFLPVFSIVRCRGISQIAGTRWQVVVVCDNVVSPKV